MADQKPEIIETAFFRLEKRNGILYGTYLKGPIDLEMAKEVVKTRLEFQAGKSYALTIDQDNLKGIDKQARDYLSEGEAVQLIEACALVSESIYEKFLANFFLKISSKKPPFPIRIVNSRTDAEKWISKQINRDR